MRIIKGRKYNPETANELGYSLWSSGIGYSLRTILYKKQSGEYFLWKQNWGSKADCIPLQSEQDAKDWLGENCAREYVRVFGEVEE